MKHCLSNGKANRLWMIGRHSPSPGVALETHRESLFDTKAKVKRLASAVHADGEIV
jgi:hypothetical protein